MEEEKFDGSGYDRRLVERIEGCILRKKPGVRWNDIANLEDAKNVLKEAVYWPMLRPDLFKGISRSWKGILMVGPPGTGKTMLAHAVATECGTTFFEVSIFILSSKSGSESKKLVRLLFEMARFYAPSTIFIDMIDYLFPRGESDSEDEISRSVKSEFLIQMDGITSTDDPSKVVMVLAVANCPWDIDESIFTRLEKRIYIPVPNAAAREALMKISLRESEISPDVDLEEIATSLEGYSGKDIARVCSRAAKMHIDRQFSGLDFEEMLTLQVIKYPVSRDDFTEVIKKIALLFPKEDLEEYEKRMAEFGSIPMLFSKEDLEKYEKLMAEFGST